MPRIRTIKPEFPQSESIGRLSRDARLLFIQIWTIADDEGRARAASRMLASLLYPYDDDAKDLIEGWLCELEAKDCIRRYEVDGSQYVEIINWLKHQKIDHPAKSRLPAYSDALAIPREASRSLAPDLGPRTEDQGPKKEPSLRSGALAVETPREKKIADGWPANYRQQFWDAYPRKKSKKAAFKALDRIARSGEVTFDRLLAGIRKIPIGEPVFIKHPATWLNSGCWDDELLPGEKNGHGPQRDIGNPSDPEYRHRHRLDGII